MYVLDDIQKRIWGTCNGFLTESVPIIGIRAKVQGFWLCLIEQLDLFFIYA